MNDEIYHRLAQVLDTLPNGFPATESGVEIRLLERVFTPEQADLFCDLRLTFETAGEIAGRTGRPLESLENRLASMAEAGQVMKIELGETRFYRMLPWVFGIYEFQLHRMNREFAEEVEEYQPAFGRQFFTNQPQLMQTLAVEEAIPFSQETLPYERVSTIIENGQSFHVTECVCKKERALLGHSCDRPTDVCLAVAPVPGVFDPSAHGRVISREEAYELLDRAEEAGLVHLTSNVQVGQFFICNCCKCCCGVLRAINDLKIPARQVVNSHYRAEIDPVICTGCGICTGERCQVGAIEESGDAYRVVPERCIGCGLCIRHCPVEAVRLVRRDPEALETPPFTEAEWFHERGRLRGVDFTPYK